jgi:SAM-dependent methyltransferase
MRIGRNRFARLPRGNRRVDARDRGKVGLLSMLSTERFTDRVADYVRYRPSYPAELLPALSNDLGVLRSGDVVADVGSGTGLLARMLLDAGHQVFGVEPNDAMRAAGEDALRGFDRFTSVAGTAEATTLADRSVDVVMAAQAFHWFEPNATKIEWRRILRDRGHVVLVWNTSHQEASPFMAGYQAIVDRFSTEPIENHHAVAKQLGVAASFFSSFEARSLPFEQVFDRVGLRGRLLSASYAPKPGHPRHVEMLEALDRLFDRSQRWGRVRFAIRTQVFAGRI